MTVRRFEHADFAQADLASPKTTPEGYLRLEGKVARTGIQIYRDAKGKTIRELRTEDEVKASLSGFSLTPLTNGHPPALVRPDNARNYAAGAIGDAAYQDGWIKAPITVWTSDAIEAIRAGRAQLSVGYTCEVVDESGEWQGQKYDARQTNIKVNHVALVDAARAGPEARLRLDAGDAASEAIACDTDTPAESTQEEGAAMPHKLMLDGFSLEVADANQAAIIERHFDAARKDADAKLAAEKTRADAAAVEIVKLTADRSALQAKVDSADAQANKDKDATVRVLDADVKLADLRDPSKADAALAPVIAKAASARADLVAEARKHLGANEKIDASVSDLDLKKKVIAKLDSTAKLDGRDDVYIAHRFDFEVEKASKNAISPIDRARTATAEIVAGGPAAPRADVAPATDPVAARMDMISRYQKANAK